MELQIDIVPVEAAEDGRSDGLRGVLGAVYRLFASGCESGGVTGDGVDGCRLVGVEDFEVAGEDAAFVVDVKEVGV